MKDALKANKRAAITISSLVGFLLISATLSACQLQDMIKFEVPEKVQAGSGATRHHREPHRDRNQLGPGCSVNPARWCFDLVWPRSHGRAVPQKTRRQEAREGTNGRIFRCWAEERPRDCAGCVSSDRSIEGESERGKGRGRLREDLQTSGGKGHRQMIGA